MSEMEKIETLKRRAKLAIGTIFCGPSLGDQLAALEEIAARTNEMIAALKDDMKEKED